MIFKIDAELISLKRKIEQVGFGGEIIEIDEDKMSKIFKEDCADTYKYNAGPNEDLELSKILLGRIKIPRIFEKEMQKDKNSPKELLSDISEDIVK